VFLEQSALFSPLTSFGVGRLQISSQVPTPNDGPLVFVLPRVSTLETSLLRALETAGAIPPMLRVLALRDRLGHELTLRGVRAYRTRLTAHLNQLLERYENVAFVPVSFFFGSGANPFPRKTILPIDFRFLPLGELSTAISLLGHPKQLHCELGKTTTATNGTELYRTLAKALYSLEKLHRGAREKPVSTVMQIVVSSEAVQKRIEHLAEEDGLPQLEGQRTAERAFDEIAARPNQRVVSALKTLLSPLIRQFFPQIDVRGIEAIRTQLSEKPVIFVPSHKSHFDYLVLAYVFLEQGIPLPLVAAGDNLNFPLAGSIIRRGGGFFIRRKIDDDPLYKTVLRRYLAYLLKQGHSVEFFIEGGRSRTGRTLSPKFGLLKAAVELVQNRERGDVQFVPISITYETLPEEKVFVEEMSGKKKRSESLLELLRVRKLLGRSYGSAVFRFGAPFSLNEFSQQLPGEAAVLEELGLEIVSQISALNALSESALLGISCPLPSGLPFERHLLVQRMEATIALLQAIAPIEGKEFEQYLTPTLQWVVESGQGRDYFETLSDRGCDVGWFETAHELIECSGSGERRMSIYRNAGMHLFEKAIFAIATTKSSIELSTLWNLFRPFYFFEAFERWSSKIERLLEEAPEQLKAGAFTLEALGPPCEALGSLLLTLRSSARKLSRKELVSLTRQSIVRDSYYTQEAANEELLGQALTSLVNMGYVEDRGEGIELAGDHKQLDSTLAKLRALYTQ